MFRNSINGEEFAQYSNDQKATKITKTVEKRTNSPDSGLSSGPRCPFAE